MNHLNKNQGYLGSFWIFNKQTLTREKKSNNLYEGKMCKGIFWVSCLLASDFLLFNVLFWSSIKKFKVLGSQVLESYVSGPETLVSSPGTQNPVMDPGSRLLGPRSRILDPGSWIPGPHFRLCTCKRGLYVKSYCFFQTIA